MAQSNEPLVLPAGLHKDGCPAERVEAFGRARPHGGGQVTVVRCIDCGGQLIDEAERGGADA